MRSSLLLFATLPLDEFEQLRAGFVLLGTNASGHFYVHAAPGELAPDDAIVLEDGSSPWSWSTYPDCVQHQWAGEDRATRPADRSPGEEAWWRTSRGLDVPQPAIPFPPES